MPKIMENLPQLQKKGAAKQCVLCQNQMKTLEGSKISADVR